MYPCGSCTSCRINRTSSWKMRIIHELDEWNGEGIFATFTYTNETLPKNFSLQKKDMQKFYKRLRKTLNKKNQKIKYYTAGEYGEKTHRPHYHAIIFGLALNEENRNLLTKTWGEGIVHCGTVTKESAGYVCGYIQKKHIGKLAKQNYEIQKREPPFQSVSQGFGLEYAMKNQEQIKQQMEITLNGKKQPIPRYYRKKLKITQNDYNLTEINKKKEETLKLLEDRAKENPSRARIRDKEGNNHTLKTNTMHSERELSRRQSELENQAMLNQKIREYGELL